MTETVLTLAMKVPAHQRAEFFELIGSYIELVPTHFEGLLGIFASLPPEHWVNDLTELRTYLVSADANQENLMTAAVEMEAEILHNALSKAKTLLTQVSNPKETAIFIFYGVARYGALEDQGKVTLLHGITDGYVIAGILFALSELFDVMDHEEKPNPADLKKLITQIKPLLETASHKLQQDPEKCLTILSRLIQSFKEIDPEKRENAVAVANRLLQEENPMWDILLHDELLSVTSVKRVDTALELIKKYSERYGAASNESTLFSTLLKIPNDQLADMQARFTDILRQGKPLLEGFTDGKCIAQLLHLVAATKPDELDNIASQSKRLLAGIKDAKEKDKISLIQVVSELPSENRDEIITSVLPILQCNLSSDDIEECLSFAASHPPDDVKNILTWTQSLLQGHNVPVYEIKGILKVIGNTPVAERENLITNAKPLLGLLKSPGHYDLKTTGYYISQILSTVAEIAPEERQDVIARALPYIDTKTNSDIANSLESILPHLAAIEPEQREVMLRYAEQLNAKLAPSLIYGPSLQNIPLFLKDITNIHPEERVHVLEAVLFTIGENTAALNEIRSYIRDQASYKIEIAHEDLKKRPVEILRDLSDNFDKKRAYQLRVTFKGQAGQDAGGLGRAFISDLFDALKTTLDFKEKKSTGLYVPTYETAPTEQTRKAYNDIGRLIMFCFNATPDYPIGMIFDPSVFTAITKFSEDLLNRPELDFDPLFTLYHEINKEDQATLNWMNENKNDPAAREMMQEMFLEHFGPLIDIAKGMRDAPFRPVLLEDVQKIGPAEFSAELQGSIDKNLVLQSLRFKDIPAQIEGWFREWIKNADNKKLSQFLSEMTGAPSIVKEIDLRVEACEGEKTISHTCGFLIELPIDILTTQETFNTNLEYNILPGGGFNII